uniref:Uncharacterized protein n=1 Tax=Chrysotila carterae TaxID=13221 RepID=A0A7S4B9V8_CHRCT
MTVCRRQFFTKAGAAVFGAVLADSASAKAGQFGKIGIFDMEDLSSPYVPGGPKVLLPMLASLSGTPSFWYLLNTGLSHLLLLLRFQAGADATFGYAKSEGPMLAKDYKVSLFSVASVIPVPLSTCINGS